MRYLFLVLLAAVLLPGCKSTSETTVSYDADANRTTYETRSYTVSSISGGNFASSKTIDMRAVARCRGRDCTTQSAQLIFTASGNQELSLSGVNGQIVADGSRVIAWTSEEAGEGYTRDASDEVVSVIGRFAAIDAKSKQLSRIASASSVEGTIGGQTFRLGSGVQSGLQSLLQRMEKRTPSPEE